MTFVEALYKSFQENCGFTVFVSIFGSIVIAPAIYMLNKIINLFPRIKYTDKYGNVWSFADKDVSKDQKNKMLENIITDRPRNDMAVKPNIYQFEHKDPRFKGQKTEVINCINCPRENICNFKSEYDAGDFSHGRRLPEDIQKWINNLYNEIKDFNWSCQPYNSVVDDKSLRGCKMLQLTHAFNVLGDIFSSFEDIKTNSEIRKKSGDKSTNEVEKT